MSATANLSSIPFESLIGGPLQAAVEAQAAAATSTIEFIERVGLDNTQTPTAVKNVTFAYAKLEEGVDKTFELTVPLLTIVPIPYMAIEEMTIDFTARLSDVVETQVNTANAFGVSGGYNGRRIKFRAGYSRTHKKEVKSRSSAEYTMDIHVRAGTQDIPNGLSRIIDILESVIVEKDTTVSSSLVAPPSALAAPNMSR